MEKMETIQDIRYFLNANRDKLHERAIEIKDLPIDDVWIQDDAWDEIK